MQVDANDPLLDVVVANRYRIVRKLGEGGMSSVYEVKHTRLHRSFALKVLLPALGDHEEAKARFQREAEMLAGLNHPNVVEIVDWDQLTDGSPCMVLEYLHGATLRQRLVRGPLPWDAIGRIGDQVMSALTLAHRNGITHRDLKPENIFMAIDDVGEERVKLLDFGVSKLRGMLNVTGVFNMIGTPQYMSPEQAQGNSEQVGPATDVWAIGAILYELATGRAAYHADSLAATLMKITTEAPDPLPAFRNDAPPQFIDLIDRTLSLDPARRINDIDELRRGLRYALDPRNFQRATPPAGMPIQKPVGSTPLVKPTFHDPVVTPSQAILPSGTSTVVASGWTRRRVLWIAGIVALLVSGGAAAIFLAL
jgi:serine/threonine-protein kinase